MAMMISKFHKIIQNKTVWAIFAVIVCVAFVGLYTGNRGNSNNSQKAAPDEVAGKVFGEKVTRSEFSNAYRNSYLMLLLSTGKPVSEDPRMSAMLRESAWQRLAILKKAEAAGLTVTDEQLVKHIRQQRIFFNPQTGQFDNNTYSAFFSQILPRLGIQITDKYYENMMRENMLIDKVSSTAVQGALVTEAEIDRAFHLYSDGLNIKYAAVPRTLAPAVEITEADALKYYNSFPNQFAYPDKVRVKYVTFPVADYEGEVSVTDEQVTAIYENNKNYFVVEGTESDPEPQFKPLEEVREEILERATHELARQKAAGAGGMFVSQLASQSATFEEVAEKAGKTIALTVPFAISDTVRGIDPEAGTFTRAAFALEDDKNHFYSDPVAGRDNVYVLALAEKKPSFLPKFDVVAEDAMEAARVTAEEDAYYSKAEEIHGKLQEALTAGTAFDEAAKALGLEPALAEKLSLAESPTETIPQQLLYATYMFPAGSLVDLIPSENQFLVAYIAERIPADRASADPMILEQLKANVQQDKASRMAEAWRDALMEEAAVEDLLDSNS
ncbi:MAG: peptidylprolyl isomerase [Pontiellaceae bacterium]|nr:peptidylprolyl isomerase [Pontiellaceae bacterium]MBN2784673.1 peptidylprolyl isomerase [Pontiellaceae bacterium]